MARYKFKVFIIGTSRNALLAAENVKSRLFTLMNEKNVDIEIIDLKLHPGLAEQENILATPTIVKMFPLPQKRVVGSLDNEESARKAIEFLMK